MEQHLWPQDAGNAVESPPAHVLRVAVERGIDRPRGDEGLLYAAVEPIEVGERVRVPLGGQGLVGGVVLEAGGVELLGDLPLKRLRRVAGREGGRMPAPLVELARWMSRYYVCPIGMVLQAMVPAAVKARTGEREREVIERVEEGAERSALEGEKLPPATRRAWEGVAGLERDAFPMPPRELADLLGLKTVGPINRLVERGLLGRRLESEVRVRGGTEPIEAGTDAAGGRPPPTPTVEQAQVIEGVSADLGRFAVHLLRGVTGSGKTEVYLRVIERALAWGLGAVVLVPEISLTPQTSSRFLERFSGAGVAVLHSALSASERHRQWRRIERGEARVVVGARSAIFAPVQRLGVVVVDEEHDSSYKADQLPRYSGRDVAVKRAQVEGAVALLGSATPSLESWRNAHEGRWGLWELPQRVGGGVLPKVRIVDIAAERPGDGAQLCSIGPTLGAALRRTLDEGAQAMLLLNRRGWASYVLCASRACGWRLRCERCDVGMVVHRGRELPVGQLVRCHHCEDERLVPKVCPDCGKRPILLGAGGQRVEEELCERYGLEPGRDLLRLDSDTMTSARAYFSALDRFARGEVRVLLGTQMIGKGLDFPGVRLVGVISADTSLGLPDFRSAERTFQLVSQVAGRAGRADERGEVVVQTMNPAEPAITLAASHDYPRFATIEMGVRERAGLPPVTRMARIVCRDVKRERAVEAAEKIAGALRDISRRGSRVEGPGECAIARVADHWRFEVVLVAPGAGEIQRMLGQVRDAGLVKSDAHTAVDVDPVSVL